MSQKSEIIRNNLNNIKSTNNIYPMLIQSKEVDSVALSKSSYASVNWFMAGISGQIFKISRLELNFFINNFSSPEQSSGQAFVIIDCLSSVCMCCASCGVNNFSIDTLCGHILGPISLKLAQNDCLDDV